MVFPSAWEGRPRFRISAPFGMNRHAVLLASAKVRPDYEAEFAAWQARQSAAILIFFRFHWHGYDPSTV